MSDLTGELKSVLPLRFRRVDKGLAVTWDHRYEVMVCRNGFFRQPSFFGVTRLPGFLRICVGHGRIWLVWPEKRDA